MQYPQRVVLDEDRTTKPAQLHGILQQAKIFRPISASHIEYRGNKIRCFDLCSLQGAHYRKLDVGNGLGSRSSPVSSRLSVVDITTSTSPRAQDRPIKGSYKRDSFRIPSINAQYALHTQPPDSSVGEGSVGADLSCPSPIYRPSVHVAVSWLFC